MLSLSQVSMIQMFDHISMLKMILFISDMAGAPDVLNYMHQKWCKTT